MVLMMVMKLMAMLLLLLMLLLMVVEVMLVEVLEMIVLYLWPVGLVKYTPPFPATEKQIHTWDCYCYLIYVIVSSYIRVNLIQLSEFRRQWSDSIVLMD